MVAPRAEVKRAETNPDFASGAQQSAQVPQRAGGVVDMLERVFGDD
jgi:hypothetical protein